MSEQVTLDGLDLSALPYGGTASITRLDGWFDRPKPKKKATSKLGRHGDFPASRIDYEPRYIELAAHIRAPDHDSLHMLNERMNGLVQQRASMRVSGHGRSTWLWVEPESEVRFTPVTDTLAVYSQTLKAPEPLRLGVRREYKNTVRNAVDASHEGNTPAPPTVVVEGSFPGGFTVYGSSDTPFTYTDSIWSGNGDVVSINFGTGVVLKNGDLAPGGSVGRGMLTDVPPYTQQRMNVIPHSDSAWGNYTVYVYDSFL